MPNRAVADGGQVGHWYQEQQRCQWQQGGAGRWPRAATLACQGYHWQDQVRRLKNINLLFLGCWMKALRQRKWDLGESSLGSLIASFENCSKASKKSPAHAYFVTNEIPPPCPRNSWKVHISWESNQMSTFDNCLFWIFLKATLIRFSTEQIDNPVVDFCQQSCASVDDQ